MKTERDGERDFYPLLKIVNNLDHIVTELHHQHLVLFQVLYPT